MGFFSYECPGCSQSIRHPGACREESRWMSNAVSLDSEGSRIKGEYDGYGRLGALDLGDADSKIALWHQACHKFLGEPSYTAPSKHARDQGHFVGEFDPREPTSVEDFASLRAKAEGEIAKARRHREGYAAQKQALAGTKCRCGRDENGIHLVMRAGVPALRCAGSRDRIPCNAPMDLDKAVQDKLLAIYAEYGMEFSDDNEVNVDFATLRSLKASLANALTICKDDSDMEYVEKIRTKVAVEAARLGVQP